MVFPEIKMAFFVFFAFWHRKSQICSKTSSFQINFLQIPFILIFFDYMDNNSNSTFLRFQMDRLQLSDGLPHSQGYKSPRVMSLLANQLVSVCKYWNCYRAYDYVLSLSLPSDGIDGQKPNHLHRFSFSVIHCWFHLRHTIRRLL